MVGTLRHEVTFVLGTLRHDALRIAPRLPELNPQDFA
jgi:hypothetical protein